MTAARDVDYEYECRRFAHVDADWAMRNGWATAPLLAAILEQLGGSVTVDPVDIERHLDAGTTPRFYREDSPARRINVRLPPPGATPGPAQVFDPCPTCGHAVVLVDEHGYTQPCNHRVRVTAHRAPPGEPARLELTAPPDVGGRRRRRRHY